MKILERYSYFKMPQIPFESNVINTIFEKYFKLKDTINFFFQTLVVLFLKGCSIILNNMHIYGHQLNPKF